MAHPVYRDSELNNFYVIRVGINLLYFHFILADLQSACKSVADMQPRKNELSTACVLQV